MNFLRDMIHAARDSAALHLLHGDVAEAERWLELAVRWEKRLFAIALNPQIERYGWRPIPT